MPRVLDRRCLSLLALAVSTGCGSDTVAPGYYGAQTDGEAGPASAGTNDADLADSGSANEVDAPASAADAQPFEGGVPTSPHCDMNGRWLVAQRVLADALGQTQASHNWFYYEITQNADQVNVTKGLHCGYEVVAVSALGANVSSQSCWPDFLTKDSDTGRQGTMEVTSSGCQLSIEKRYTVRGASVLYYEDPTTTLPTMSQQASGSTPGWSSWCGVSNPGVTLVVTGAAMGDLFCVQRDWNQWTGPVAADSTTFQVPTTWGSEQDALGYSGSSLVTQPSVPDSDASQHYVWFAKLAPTQATGTDTEICSAVRSLVSTLTPDALK